MASILTPTQIFKDVAVDSKPKTEDINITVEDGIIRQEFYINGKSFDDGSVKIYTLLEKPMDAEELNAVIVVGELGEGVDTKLVRKLAKMGYLAVSIDLAGRMDDRELFTIYPQSIEYANLEKSNYKETSINEDVLETCWFQWDCNLLYLFKHLKARSDVKKIAIIGIGEGAVPVWHVIGSTEKVSGAVICLNAGWKGYRGHYKNLDNPEPNFTDGEVKYLAGIEPQTYARHLKSPIYLLVATNDDQREFDRAYDSLTRIESKCYSCVNYSVGNRNAISYADFKSAYLFLQKSFEREGNKRIALAEEITCNLEEGEDFKFVVSAKTEELKELSLYIASKATKPSLRSFKKFNGGILDKPNKYSFTISKDAIDGDFVYFIKGVYQNDYRVCSLVYYRNGDNNKLESKQKVWFSAREDNSQTIFYPLQEQEENSPKGVQVEKGATVELAEGPRGMTGVTCKGGLLTFIINDKEKAPLNDAMLMIDAYVKGGGVLTVKLVSDYFGNRTEYMHNITINGNFGWQNVKIQQKDFKTVEGMGLKDYGKIECMEIFVDGDKEYVVNNILWV